MARRTPSRAGPCARCAIGAAALILLAVTAYLVAVAGRSRETPIVTSIGVMPLENAGEIRDGEYLADGIAASLRSRLAQFSSIRQAAASEAARYERLGVSPAQAGREMRVAAVLTGTLEHRAETVIVRLELVRSADGAGLWKRQFVRPIDDLLTLQTEIARELVEELGISSRRLLVGGNDTRDPAAYQLYTKGRYHVQRRTPGDLRKGLEYLREAVAIDPGYGRAHAKLADAYNSAGDDERRCAKGVVPSRENRCRARTRHRSGALGSARGHGHHQVLVRLGLERR